MADAPSLFVEDHVSHPGCDWIILCGGDLPEHCGVSSSTPGLHPPPVRHHNASSAQCHQSCCSVFAMLVSVPLDTNPEAGLLDRVVGGCQGWQGGTGSCCPASPVGMACPSQDRTGPRTLCLESYPESAVRWELCHLPVSGTPYLSTPSGQVLRAPRCLWSCWGPSLTRPASMQTGWFLSRELTTWWPR